MEFPTSLELERIKNVLSPYYTDPQTPVIKKKDQNMSPVQRALKGYTHEDALRFATASLFWKDDKGVQGRQKIQALYRVISEKNRDYILEACHANVHGTHRGDLRFIEVRGGTSVEGVTEKTCFNGRLWPGDIVSVTQLKRIKEFEDFPISATSHDTPCVWMAANITILPRLILEDETFALLENGTAVVKEGREVMNVKSKVSRVPGKLYKGTCFIPEKIKFNFTVDHNKGLINKLIKECSKIHASPNALGTIFKSQESPELSKMFNVGWDACSTTVSHPFKPSDVVELCTLMGYSAAVSLGNGRNDSRSFPMGNVQREGDIIHFSIENPEENPTDDKWMIKTRVEIRGNEGNGIKSNATIDSIIPEGRHRLRIAARLSREVKKSLRFTNGIHVVCQQEAYEVEGLRSGFFEKLPRGSNGHRILEALYGGPKISYEFPECITQCFYTGVHAKTKLNVFQCAYVHMLMAKPQVPMVVGSSPFGCGKSLTIVTAAQAIYENVPGKVKPKQLLITQSNYASVNLVDIASKLHPDSRFKFVRYLSEKNYEEFPVECLTEHDIQNLMKILFSSWAKGEITSKLLKNSDFQRMLNFVLFRKLVEPGNLSGQALAMYDSKRKLRKPYTQDLRKACFILHNPDVIMTTADSLLSLLNAELLRPHEVCTIQIDEASQVPEHTLIRLLTQFPHANYGLIGDIQQLPPYCETGLVGKLKDYGIGNTMERAVKEKLFPQAMLREVYRCHPKITNLLSGLFYDGRLISGITEKDRSEFMTKRPDFWPMSQFPVLIVNNEDHGMRMGTSCGNKSEVQIVKNLLSILTAEYNGYQLQPSNIGVISFYAAQTSVLTESLRGKKVKCGTVDAFQGTERDVIILCCTNEKISEFMQLSNRINVAMSRAKQVTIIVGNVEGLKKAKYWGTIVKKAEENENIIEKDSLHDVYLENRLSEKSGWTSIEQNNNTIPSHDSTEHQLVNKIEKLELTSRKKCCACEYVGYLFCRMECDHKICRPCKVAKILGGDISCAICNQK